MPKGNKTYKHICCLCHVIEVHHKKYKIGWNSGRVYTCDTCNELNERAIKVSNE